MGPRAKLVGLASLFLLPIAASIVAYNLVEPGKTSNFGELLLPPASITTQPFTRPEGAAFAFSQLAGRWVLVASDSGACPQPCRDKLATLRQVRLALGRNAVRVERVFVVDDVRPLEPSIAGEFAGMIVALTPQGLSIPAGAANDRAHVYLVDPHGNVMMRWPAGADRKRMLGDLQRLLKASQIG
jgi:cytochrome oxidase Cu insertion factor (SCO1/SenC/PrrC family)